METQDLTVALDALEDAGAMILPRRATIEKAPMGKVWSGKKANGELWTLTKQSMSEYVWTC